MCFKSNELITETRIGMNDSSSTDENSGFRVDPTPITLEAFFEDHHYSNKDNVYDDNKETVLNPKRAFVSEAQIADMETSFEICFPKKLRALYLQQNGGYVSTLVTPLVENPSLIKDEDWLMPFGGYEDLRTLEQLETFYESATHYADPEEELEDFPIGCKRMIVIAQWYRHTLFLDYRNSDEPRIGFTDFDSFEDLQNSYWESQAHWWDDFDTFFAQLRRSENL